MSNSLRDNLPPHEIARLDAGISKGSRSIAKAIRESGAVPHSLSPRARRLLTQIADLNPGYAGIGRGMLAHLISEATAVLSESNA